MLIRVELPVVVKPHMLSKKAFAKEGIAPLSIKGRVPNSASISQAMVTVR